jgi:hypothetical protein
VCVRACVCACVHACVHACVRACVRACMRVYMYVRRGRGIIAKCWRKLVPKITTTEITTDYGPTTDL